MVRGSSSHPSNCWPTYAGELWHRKCQSKCNPPAKKIEKDRTWTPERTRLLFAWLPASKSLVDPVIHTTRTSECPVPIVCAVHLAVSAPHSSHRNGVLVSILRLGASIYHSDGLRLSQQAAIDIASPAPPNPGYSIFLNVLQLLA